jgi:hypothetical protein
MTKRPVNVSIDPVNYRAPLPDGLLPVALPDGQAAAALAAAGTQLAEKFGKWADQDAKLAGEKDAKIAAAEGNFTPTGRETIYGRAYDTTALDAQVTSATSTFRTRALELYDQHRADPAALRAALEADARAGAEALPAEARAGFHARVNEIGVSVQRQAINNAEANRVDRARADLSVRMTRAETQRNQILAADPSSPEAEAAALRVRDETIADIRRQMTDPAGPITAVQGEALIAKANADAQSAIVTARAATLRTPEEIDAYRQRIRKDFAEGRMPGLTEIDTLDGQLTTLARTRRVEGDRLVRELNTKLDDVTTRAARGQQPTLAEMATLEQDAARAGPRGQVALETARQRMGLAALIAGRPIPEQDRVLREVEQRAREAAGRSTPEEQATAAFYRRSGFGDLQAAAITSYLVAESTLNPNATNRGDGRDGSDSIGMGQWNAERATALRAFAAARGRPATDPDIQRAFVIHELNTTHKAAGDRLRAATTPEEATAAMVQYGAPGGYRSGPGGHLGVPSWGARLENTRRISGGMSATGAETVQWLRGQVEANRSAVNTDMLGYAADRNLLGGSITEVDFGAAPDQLAGQIGARVAQVDALAGQLQRPNPTYLRPEDKARLSDVVTRGGEPALATIEAVIRGAGPRATTILKEIGGDAPALAHAAAIAAATGDRSFARTVAEGLASRHVAGANPPRPTGDDMRDAEQAALGASLRGMRTDERERTQAAVGVWFEVEAQRRGIDPKNNPTGAKALLEEGFRRSRGETRQSGVAYGGVTAYRSPAWGGGTVQVQVLPEIRQDRFGQVLGALTDQDLAGLPNKPVFPGGQPMTADALRRMHPVFGPGGYRFVMPQLDGNGAQRPVVDAEGRPFLLDLRAMMPEIRRRVPDAFR